MKRGCSLHVSCAKKNKRLLIRAVQSYRRVAAAGLPGLEPRRLERKPERGRARAGGPASALPRSSVGIHPGIRDVSALPVLPGRDRRDLPARAGTRGRRAFARRSFLRERFVGHRRLHLLSCDGPTRSGAATNGTSTSGLGSARIPLHSECRPTWLGGNGVIRRGFRDCMAHCAPAPQTLLLRLAVSRAPTFSVYLLSQRGRSALARAVAIPATGRNSWTLSDGTRTPLRSSPCRTLRRWRDCCEPARFKWEASTTVRFAA